MDYLFSLHPLSKKYIKQIEDKIKKPVHILTLSELRKLSVLKMIIFLRKLNANIVFLALEDASTLNLLPILQLILIMFKCKKKNVIYPDLHFQFITSKDMLKNLIRAFSSIFLTYCVYKKQRHRVFKFYRKKPILFDRNKIKKSQRVLYLNGNIWFGLKVGGSVGHITGVVNALSSIGKKVDYAAMESLPCLSKKIRFFQMKSTPFGVPLEFNYYKFSDCMVRALMRKKVKWDFIYQRMSVGNIAGVELSQKLNIPLILEYNGSEAWIAQNWGKKPLKTNALALMAEDVCLKHACIVMTVSKLLKKELINRGVLKEKIVYYPNCIDPRIFNPDRFPEKDCLALRKKYHVEKDAIVLTFVGTFGIWHGVDILAHVIRRMIETKQDLVQRKKICFFLIGDGSKMLEVKQILGPMLEHPSIKLTGLIAQDEASYYMAMSDVFLSPHVQNIDGSRFFGSPTKLFEYMAMGKPIIASRIEQIEYVLTPSLDARKLEKINLNETRDKLSILCEPGSIDDIICAIEFLCNHRELRLRLGENARREALNKYTWENHIKMFLD